MLSYIHSFDKIRFQLNKDISQNVVFRHKVALCDLQMTFGVELHIMKNLLERI